MMLARKEFRIAAFSLAIIFLAVVPAFAGDSATIRVSCTIPEIAGVNLPLEKENKPGNSVKKETSKASEEPNSPSMLQKDTKEKMMIAGKNLTVEVKTIYRK